MSNPGSQLAGAYPRANTKRQTTIQADIYTSTNGETAINLTLLSLDCKSKPAWPVGKCKLHNERPKTSSGIKPLACCFEATVLTTTPYLKLQCFVSHESVNSAIFFSKRCIHLAAESVVWQLGSPVQEAWVLSALSWGDGGTGEKWWKRRWSEGEPAAFEPSRSGYSCTVDCLGQTGPKHGAVSCFSCSEVNWETDGKWRDSNRVILWFWKVLPIHRPV